MTTRQKGLLTFFAHAVAANSGGDGAAACRVRAALLQRVAHPVSSLRLPVACRRDRTSPSSGVSTVARNLENFGIDISTPDTRERGT